MTYKLIMTAIFSIVAWFLQEMSIHTRILAYKNEKKIKTKSDRNSRIVTCSRHRNLQNIWIPILQIFVFVYRRGTRKHFYWSKIFFGRELEFEYFVGSDVVNKLINVLYKYLKYIRGLVLVLVSRDRSVSPLWNSCLTKNHIHMGLKGVLRLFQTTHSLRKDIFIT